MDFRKIFIHVCGERAIDRGRKLTRLTGDTGNGYCYFKFWFYMTIYVRRDLIFTKCHDVPEAVHAIEKTRSGSISGSVWRTDLILSSFRETRALTRRNTSSEVMKSQVKAFRAPLPVHVTPEKCKENIKYDPKIENIWRINVPIALRCPRAILKLLLSWAKPSHGLDLVFYESEDE